jgi:signal transduction histidine kinase
MASAIGALWTLTLAGKNIRLRQAERELRSARDELAVRVETRIDQLQDQLHARREQWAVFAAVNEERNRLARELRDSAQQHFASAALQLEAFALSFSDGEREQASTCATALREGQDEVRSSVWGLRSLALERHSIAEAIREGIALLLQGLTVKGEVAVDGKPRDLPSTVENHHLRIAQEAAANSLKHARATDLRIALHYGERELQLTIGDDGCGF